MKGAAEDLRLRIPGFRRYAVELHRLRTRAAEAEELRAKLDAVERELRVVRGHGLSAAGGDAHAEWLARARRFEYYWANAQKKIDLVRLRPFGPLATRVVEDGRTFLNVDRLYTLWQAVTRMPPNGAAVAEVGVFKGGSAKFIAEAMIASNLVLPFFACDTFRGHAAVDDAVDGQHRVGKQFSSPLGELAPRVVKYLRGYEFVEVIEGDIRETASRLAGQHAFGMVHIDVDVYPVTKFCLDFFSSRVVVGAVIVVDDYGFKTCLGAKKAVDEFVAGRSGEFRAMHLLTGQAVLIRTA